ncbi:hypothetical protein [Cohnella caldifontis]|uniref:hypothetical protein n=1 Tax=Cohnella caldifontis TaxID=3027471 RepID=UPI0023EDFFFD|nr:hypothetical protein [Cohnella sp. YIM B05605]
MIEALRLIGDNLIRFRLSGPEAERYLAMTIGSRPVPPAVRRAPDYTIAVSSGYGHPLEIAEDAEVPVAFEETPRGLTFTRADYRLAISADRREADIGFCDYFSLRTALLNWLSTVLTERRWGLIVHSSCVVNDGEAHLFTGYSGAGKSTVAALSRPRPLLADESSILQVPEVGRILVHDSPFRNDFPEPAGVSPVPLRAVYLLEQSTSVGKRRLRGSEAMLALFDKIVHWKYDNRLSAGLVRQCKTLVERVPVYVLEFQKNDRFWEVIS